VKTSPFARIATVLFFGCVLLLLFIPIKTRFNFFDEGFSVLNAARIATGEVPYRDFFTIYLPGQFYALSAVFTAFGTGLLAARIYDILVRFVLVLSVYCIARRLTTRALALVAAAAVTILLASAWFYTYPIFPALALGLLSVASVLEYARTCHRRWLLLAGLLLGVAALFRWDMGACFGLSAVLTLLLARLSPAGRDGSSGAARVASELLWLVGGVLVVLLPCLAWLGWKAGFRTLWSQLVVAQWTIIRLRWKPYPPLLPDIIPARLNLHGLRVSYAVLVGWLEFYLPIALYLLAFVHYGLALARRRTRFSTQQWGTLAMALVGALMLNQALNRYDHLHVLSTWLFVPLVAVGLIHEIGLDLRPLAIKRCFLLLWTALGALYLYSLLGEVHSALAKYPPWGCYSSVERAGCVSLWWDEEEAVHFIRTHTVAGEPIYVGNRQHDVISISDSGFYFLADRPSATQYHELEPGITTTEAVQRTIVEEIEARQVRWIVLMDGSDYAEPNGSGVSSGVYVLDEFIRSRFAQVAEFGNYQVWARLGP